jgi:hypothetical protein
MSEELQSSLPVNKELRIPCGSCDRETFHLVLAEVVMRWKNEIGDGFDEFFTVQCRGCKTISYCKRSFFSEDEEFDEEKNCYVPTPIIDLYPSRIAGRSLLQDAYELPHGLYRVYKETHSAICNKLRIVAGMGLRAITEAICNERSVQGKDLRQKIDALVTQGLITNDGAVILHEIRYLGNAAAHEAKANTEAELHIALEVVEHLLSGVYILPKRASTLQKKPKGPG